jgi:beta-galactosidase
MCGFPKDYFYYYKAWWRKEPSLHLFPHWNWQGREGQDVAVWAYSNLDKVELFLNGHSQGRQRVPHLGHVQWKVRYQPSVIEARGYKQGKLVLTEKRETTGPVVALRLSAVRTGIAADREDVAIIKIEAVDHKGRVVPTANTKLAFKIAGAGKLIGVGNGDPNSLESDKGNKRSLFNGLAQLIVQSSGRPGQIRIEAMGADRQSAALRPATLVVTARPMTVRPTVS